MTEIERINDWLHKQYGHDILRRPWWRLIWSEEPVEKRKGRFFEYYGNIFLREFYGVREQKKYAYHPEWRDRWILEKLMFDLPNPEIVQDQAGTYETIYVFWGPKMEYIKPTLKAVQFFMFMLEERQKKRIVFTDAQWDAEEQREMDREAEGNYGYMEDKFGGDLATALRVGEGTARSTPIFPGTEIGGW